MNDFLTGTGIGTLNAGLLTLVWAITAPQTMTLWSAGTALLLGGAAILILCYLVTKKE